MAINCEQCGKTLKDRTYRYCPSCRAVVLGRLHRCGYLQDTYVPPYFNDSRGRKGARDPRALGGVPY
jgi:predicted RNA-binding Zn-ribbon protein involved in translation (DUF1610 family)